MSYSAITQPNKYMAGYSAIPLKVYSTDNTLPLFKYIINACWNTVTISADQSINIGNNVYTLLTTTTPHLFEIGDTILLNDSINSGQFTDYYIVQKIVSSTQFAINLIPNTPFGSSGFTCSNVIKWKLNPDLDGYGKLDLSTSLKDFVSQNLTGQTVDYALSYNAPDTKFCYTLFAGSEKQYEFRFVDNLFVSGGTVAFYDDTLLSLAGVPFQIGDTILITQDVVQWPYTDNYFNSGGVGFTGTTQHSFLVGQPITITGQQTYPFYNGQSTILSKTTNGFVINKSWQGSTPVEPGFAYGVPRPEYNTTAVITNIYYDIVYGVVIETDIPFTTSSVAIPGSITYSNGQITTNPIETTLTGSCVFNARISNNDYSMTAFDKYVVQLRTYTGNNISTILSAPTQYRIEPNTIGFLLVHTYKDTYVDGMFYEFYNSSGGALGTLRVPKASSGQTDFYAPIGLEQVGGATYTDITGTFSSYSGSVNSYKVYAYDATSISTQVPRTNEIYFKINPDCSMYEMYHIMWKDSYGSFVSYPFIYMSRDNISVDRKTYYKQNGNWENNTFGYLDYDKGEKNFYSKSRKSLVLNSGWLYQFETALMEDLMQSSSVYVQTPDNRLFQAHLNETELELYKNINEQLFSYTFNLRLSNNEYRF
jgi:hypothetical protein